ncbi:MAG: hypothetical protein ACLGI6_01460 [Gammaproteobacteria bacterium]
MKLKLYNADIEITQARTVYDQVRSHFEDVPDAAVAHFLETYRSYTDCHQLADAGYAMGKQIIAGVAQLGVDYLVEHGFYDLTYDLFYTEYLAPYLGWSKAFSEWDDAYGDIIAEGAEMEAYRQRRMDNRARFVGGGFGISGAAKGIAMAGAANAAWGMAHGLRNAVAAARTRAAQKKDLSALLNNKQVRDFLADAIRMDTYAVHLAVFTFIVRNDNGEMPDFLGDDEKIERAARLQANMAEGKIPLSKAPDLIPEILEGNPYAQDRYRLALDVLGDPDNELQLYGHYHDTDVLAMKQQIIQREIEPLLRASDFASDQVADKLTQLATRLGCMHDDDTRALFERIDQQGRTFEQHVYPSPDIMRQAMQERERLAAAVASFSQDLGREREQLSALQAQPYVYHGAEAFLNTLRDKIAALDLKQRSFDGHVYASQAEARQARADKQAIQAVHVVGSQIGKVLDREREKLAQLRTQSFVYAKADEIMEAYAAAIDAEDVRQRSVDGQVYPTREEAAKARAASAAAAAERKQAEAASAVPLRPASTSDVGIGQVDQGTEQKSLSLGLILGVVLFPFVAPFLTLRKGYTTQARVFAFAVLALYAYAFASGKIDLNQPKATATQAQAGVKPMAAALASATKAHSTMH